MKTKVISFLMFVGLLFVFPSCEGPMGPMGPEGLPGEKGGMEKFNVTVKSGQWIRDTEAGAFFCVIEDKRFEHLEGDGILVDIVDANGYFRLPLTEYFFDEGYLAETISFSYDRGWIRITVAASDLFDNAGAGYKQPDLTFKVTLFWLD